MYLKSFVSAAAFVAIAAAGSVHAQDNGNDRWAVGVNAGTLGLGGTVQYKASDRVVVHADFSSFDIDETISSDDIDYNTQIDVSSTSLSVDLHPFKGSFFVSAGLATGNKDISLSATPTSSQEVGEDTYTPQQIGTLKGTIKFPDTSTSLGLGWDKTFYGTSPINFRAFLGVQVSGSPEVKLSSNGTLANDPAFQANLREEEAEIEDDADMIKMWPVAQVSLTYRF